MTRPSPTALQTRRLMIWVYYNGPFGHICDYLWRVNEPHDAEGNALDPKHEVKDNSLRDRLAALSEFFDRRWRSHYARHNAYPPVRWKRPDTS